MNSRFAVAVHVLALMAKSGDEPVKSEQMAGSVNTNPVVIRRILCVLARAELIKSQTGAAGGSKLAREPNQITLLDVYRAMEEGGVFSLHRQSPNRHCLVGGNIGSVLRGVLDEVNLAVERSLATTTIDQVLQNIQASARMQNKAGLRR